MKIFRLFSLLLLPLGLFAQTPKTLQPKKTDPVKSPFDKKIVGNWVKIKIDMADGSTFVDPDGRQSQAEQIMAFDSEGFVKKVTLDDNFNTPYVLRDSLLYIKDKELANSQNATNWTNYKVEKLTPFELIFSEYSLDVPIYRRMRYYFARSETKIGKLINERFVYPDMRASIDDTLFTMSRFVYPSFNFAGDFDESYQQSFNFIERVLNYPSNKSGLFRIQFAVTKTGEINKIRINESTNPKYDEKLKNAVRASKGSWQPAKLDGHPVSVLVRYEFGYGSDYYQKDYAAQNKMQDAKYYYDQGVRQYAAKDYERSVQSFSKSIEFGSNNPQNYFNRGAAYIALGQKDKACVDWKYLVDLGQKWVEKYVNQYCK